MVVGCWWWLESIMRSERISVRGLIKGCVQGMIRGHRSYVRVEILLLHQVKKGFI